MNPSQHALHCGAGEGMFLLLKETAIVLLRYGITGSFYSSPYLGMTSPLCLFNRNVGCSPTHPYCGPDVHGEEDSGLRRGRPLYLDLDRYGHAIIVVLVPVGRSLDAHATSVQVSGIA